MAATKTLLQLRTAVISGAAIDGQAVVGGRHPPSDLNERLNRYIAAVRSFARSEGAEIGQALTDIGTLPAATASEDFIEVEWPDTAEEVTGVDVLTSGSPKWQPLDAADWSQRRSLNSERGYPSGGVGWWAIKSLPEARASADVTAGTLALFPADLTGSYRISYVEQWTPMSADGHKWAYHADHDTWVINAVVMELTQRDTNKKGLFALAERNFLRAEARIKAACGRVGPGYAVPVRAGGEWV